MRSDDEFNSLISKTRRADDYFWQRQHKRVREDYNYYDGNEAAYSVGANDGDQRVIVNINRTKPVIKAVNGFFRQLAAKPTFSARMLDDMERQIYSEGLCAVSDYVRNRGYFEHVEGERNKCMLVCGYGVTDTGIDDYSKVEGQIVKECVDPLLVTWDASARMKNASDKRWIERKRLFPIDEAMARFPKAEEGSFEKGIGDETKNRSDGMRSRLRTSDDYDVINTDHVWVRYYQFKELETVYEVKNPLKKETAYDPELLKQSIETALDEIADEYAQKDEYEDGYRRTLNIESDTFIIEVDAFQKMKKYFDLLDIELEYTDRQKWCFYTVIYSGNEIFRKFKSLVQEDFTLQVVTCEFDRQENVWYGMMRHLKEPATYYCKALTEILLILASNSKGGVLYEKGVTDDPVEFEQKYAKTDASVMINNGTIDRLRPKATALMPNGYDSMLPVFEQNIMRASGVNPEFLGSSENQQASGVLEAQRIKQASSVLADYLDGIIMDTKANARIVIPLSRVLVENNGGLLVSSVGEDGSDIYMKITKDILDVEFEVTMSEADITPAIKEQQATAALSLATQVFAATQNPAVFAWSARFLKNYGVAQRDISAFIEMITPKEPDPKQQQVKELQQQLEQQAAELKLTKMQSDIHNKDADTMVRETTALKNRIETEQKKLENIAMQAVPIDQYSANINI